MLCQDSPLFVTDWALDEERSQCSTSYVSSRGCVPLIQYFVAAIFSSRATPDDEVHDIRWLDTSAPK